MCLIAPQQNHTDSPLCYTGAIPLRGHCVRLATLRLSPSPQRGLLKGRRALPIYRNIFTLPDRRMQFADGTSPITYTVTGSIAGRRVTMSAYSVKPLSGELSVTPDPLSSTNIRTGKITSTNSEKSKLNLASRCLQWVD